MCPLWKQILWQKRKQTATELAASPFDVTPLAALDKRLIAMTDQCLSKKIDARRGEKAETVHSVPHTQLHHKERRVKQAQQTLDILVRIIQVGEHQIGRRDSGSGSSSVSARRVQHLGERVFPIHGDQAVAQGISGGVANFLYEFLRDR
jgi:hypothetical protein